MKNLRLIPEIHRHEPIVKAGFAYDRELIVLYNRKRARVGVSRFNRGISSKKSFCYLLFMKPLREKFLLIIPNSKSRPPQRRKLKKTPRNIRQKFIYLKSMASNFF